MRDTRVWLAAGGLFIALCAVNIAGQVTAASGGVSPGGRQAPSPPAPPPPLKPGAAVILGRVVEAGSTTGVAGAVVVLSGGALGRPDTAFTNGTPGGPRRVVADAQGQFVFRDLPPGTYNIDTTAAGYVDGVYGQKRIIQIRRTLDLIRTVNITESDRLVQATIEMFRKGGISGRVVDEAGEPMVGMSLTILARMTDWGGPVTQIAHNATTDDRGQYHVDVVPGDYLIGVLAATTTFPVEMVDAFVSAQAEGGAVFQAVVEQMAGRAGMLPRGVGTRIGSVRVSQFGSRNAPVVPPMSTDGSAWFYPSTYHPASLSSIGASIVSVASGEEKSGIDLQMRPVPARRISGRLVGPDGPAAMLGVRLVSSDPTVQRTSPATLIDVPQAMADGNGAFVFIGVAPGAYTLYAIKRASAGDQTMLWAADPVAVGDSDVKDVEIRLQPGAPIAGRVVFEGTPPTPDQLRSVAITPYGVPGSTAALNAAPSARPNPNGTFNVVPLVPGPYRMSLTTQPSGWTLKSITTGGQNAVDRTFELTPSGITDMVVTFTDKRSVLTGVVRDADGEPGTAATVAVFPVDRGLWRLPGMASRRVQTVAPQRDGRYTFGGLPDGDYYLVAADWPTADFSDALVLTKTMPFASRVTI
ncbi:MAG TPA: carboxypeptidase-like regulatory domain-containing protein, partial [Vicinamibacterales bacterium]|nr:carboxypeptidase-like regulatory domain-containing protein [Vicinamibacterales bacterium]